MYTHTHMSIHTHTHTHTRTHAHTHTHTHTFRFFQPFFPDRGERGGGVVCALALALAQPLRPPPALFPASDEAGRRQAELEAAVLCPPQRCDARLLQGPARRGQQAKGPSVALGAPLPQAVCSKSAHMILVHTHTHAHTPIHPYTHTPMHPYALTIRASHPHSSHHTTLTSTPTTHIPRRTVPLAGRDSARRQRRLLPRGHARRVLAQGSLRGTPAAARPTPGTAPACPCSRLAAS